MPRNLTRALDRADEISSLVMGVRERHIEGLNAYVTDLSDSLFAWLEENEVPKAEHRIIASYASKVGGISLTFMLHFNLKSSGG